MNKKELVVRFKPLVNLACQILNLRNLFRIRGKKNGNRVKTSCALLKKVNIRFSGSNNTVLIEDFSILKNVSLYISGDNNVVHIGPWCYLNQAEFCTEDEGNRIEIGEHTRIMGQTHLAAIEGTEIRIGRDCLFSSEVHVRTGDSHSVLNLEGKRINPSADITIGDHVWMGTKTTCLKGAAVPDNSIVGACALVTGKFTQPHSALAGVPAKVVKQDVDWCIQRIPVE